MEAQSGKTPPVSRQGLRDRSKLLFGNRDRLEVANAIARSEDGAVNATDLSWELRIANNRVRSQLLALRDLGFLDEAAPQAGKRWYVRRESPFWEFCEQLYDEWGGR